MLWLMATRPAFLVVTAIACCLGFVSAWSLPNADFYWDQTHVGKALIAFLLALLAHAGANVLNDYYDAKNGTDALNQHRVSPFTGGSRMIQNGWLSERQTLLLGALLIILVIPAGLYLAVLVGWGLIGIGLGGLILAWGYSSPPLFLAGRALGEIAITLAWLLVVIGGDYILRQSFAFAPIAVGLGYALMVANILYINQFPDVLADAAVGKRTLVVRWGCDRAHWGYGGLLIGGYGWIVLMVVFGSLPTMALCTLLSAIPGLRAWKTLHRYAQQPQALKKALAQTILCAIEYGLLLMLALAFARR